MSASDKKKLRREQEAAKMTERQLAEQKEAKKLKLFTTLFIVVLAVIVAIAAINDIDLARIIVEKDKKAAIKYNHKTNLENFLENR